MAFQNITFKYKEGGQGNIRYAIDYLNRGNVDYYLVADTDRAVNIIYKLVDGYFAGEKSTQGGIEPF